MFFDADISGWTTGVLAFTLAQLLLTSPEQLLRPLTALLRLAGVHVLHINNDAKHHSEIKWVQAYLGTHAWCYSRKLLRLENTDLRAYAHRMLHAPTAANTAANPTADQDPSSQSPVPAPVAFDIGSGPFAVWTRRFCVWGLCCRARPTSAHGEGHCPLSFTVFCWSSAAAAEFLLTTQREYHARVYPPHRLQYSQAIVTDDWAWWSQRDTPPIALDRMGLSRTMEDFRKLVGAFAQQPAQSWVTRKHKRKHSVLLYGEPGSGKTHFAKAVAARYGLLVYDLNMGSGMVDDFALQLLTMRMDPRPKMLLLDEFDAVQQASLRWKMRRSPQRDADGGSGSGGVDAMAGGGRSSRDAKLPSKSGWNRLLDGDWVDNVLIVLITNLTQEEITHIYGETFLRSRRIDHTFYFGGPDEAFVHSLTTAYDLNIFLDPEHYAGATVADVVTACEATARHATVAAADAVTQTTFFVDQLRDLTTAAQEGTRGGNALRTAAQRICDTLQLTNVYVVKALSRCRIQALDILLPMTETTLQNELELSVGDSYALAQALDRYEERPLPSGTPLDAPAAMARFPERAQRRLRRALQRHGDWQDLERDGRVHRREWHTYRRAVLLAAARAEAAAEPKGKVE